MKKILLFFVFSFWLCLNLIQSQCPGVRPNILSYTPAQRIELRNLIMDYVRNVDFDASQTGVDKYGIVRHHTMHLPLVHGTNSSRFFTWHRYYLQELEHWLLEKGKTEFLPLPAWNPNTTNTPTARLLMNAFVPTVNNVSILPAAHGFLAVNSFPSGFNFSPYTGAGKCSFAENGSPSFSAGAEGQHNNVHSTMGGAMTFTNQSPGAAIFWPWHGWVDDLYYCYQKDCKGNQADLYIKDTPTDDGSTPNNATNLWSSPDIWVRNTNDGFQTGNDNSQTLDQTLGYVYVKVHNRGTRPNDNLAGQIKMYWAKASTGLSWPSPWDGNTSITCGPHTLVMGGQIGTQPLRRINEPFTDFTHTGAMEEEDYTIYEYQWTLPDPDKYQNCFTNDEHKHFCLLAKIEDGTELPGTTDLWSNVKNDNNLAWRNITIMGDGAQTVAPPEEWVMVGNYTPKDVYNDATFEIFFPTKKDLGLLQVADLDITLGDALVKMWTGKGQNIKQLNQKEIRIVDNQATIEGFTFGPNEKSAMGIKINPKVATKETYTFDLIQYNEGKIIGGETYIVKPFGNPVTCDCKSVEANFYQTNRGCEYTFGIKGMEKCIEKMNWSIDGVYYSTTSGINEITSTLTSGRHQICYETTLQNDGEGCHYCIDVIVDCDNCSCDAIERSFYQSNKGCDYIFGVNPIDKCIENIDWYIDGKLALSGSNEVIIALPSGGHQICYVAKLQNGEVCKYYIDVKSDCCKLPQADATGHLRSCPDQNEGIVVLNSSYDITWTSADGTVIVASANNIIVTGLNPGTYTYTVSDGKYTCDYTVTIEQDSCCRFDAGKAKVKQNTNLKQKANLRIGKITAPSIESDLLQVIPNPANEAVLLKFPTSKVANRTVALFTSEGKLIVQKTVDTADTSVEFDSSGFPSGIFIAQLLEQGRVVNSAKVVIQH